MTAQTIEIGLGDSARVVIAPGTKFAVPVRAGLQNAAPLTLASLQAGVTWPSGRITFDSVRVVSATGFSLTENIGNAPNGSMSLGLFNTSALNATGTLANLWFTAGSTAGSARLNITPTVLGSETGVDILSRALPRGLDVCVASSARWGDVTDDALVNIIDAQQIARFSVGLTVTNPTAMAERGDVNADGNVNIIDAQQIARFGVGLSASPRIATSIVPVAPVASMAATVSSSSILVGRAATIAAEPRDAGGTSLAGCFPVSYSSSAPTIASVSNTGVVTALSTGTATITASSEGKSAAVNVTVSQVPVALVQVSPSTRSMQVGQLVPLVASALDDLGAPLTGRTVSWQTSNPNIATVNGSGVVTGVSIGAATITASSEGKSGTAAVTVGAQPVAAITVSPTTTTLLVGRNVAITATPRDSAGNALTGRVISWATSAPSVATVSDAGLVTGISVGSATITAASEGVSAVATVTVSLAPIASVTVSPTSAAVEVGGNFQLSATPRDSTDAPLSGRTVTWNSSAPTVASVSAAGLVTGVSLGTATVTATSEGKSATVAIQVVQPVASLGYVLEPDPTITAATAFTVQVRALNSLGEPIPDNTSRIRLTLVPSGVGTDSLIGNVEQATANGVATFSGLKVNKAAAGYKLRATVVGTNKTSESNAFDITIGLASKLAIVEQPQLWTAGVQVGATPVRVEVQDAGGNRVTFANPTVTLSLAAAPSGATLGGTLTATAVNGLANFASLSLTVADTVYQLRASATNLTAGTGSRFTVQSAEPAKLRAVRSPSTTVAGTALSPSPQVEVLDQFNNRVLYSSDSVFIRLTGPTTAVSGAVRRAAVNGLVDFTGLTVTLAGGGYQLVAESPSITSASSASFTVNPAAATALRFTTDVPSSVTAGVTITPGVVVTAFDAFDNVATTTTGNVVLAPSAETPVTVLGTLTRALTNGAASFTDLSIRVAGAAYRLTATRSGISAVTSGTVTVQPAAPNKLAMVQQPPANALGGTAWETPVVVRVEDSFNNLVDTATTTVTAGLSGGSAGAALGGTKVRAAVGGIATFPGLSIDRAGTGYAVPFTATGIASVTSSAVTVAVGPAAALRYMTQPGATAQGQPLTNTPQIEVVDAGGNRVTTATNRVTVSLQGSTRGATLAGTLGVNAVNGVARFDAVGVTLNEAGLRLAAASTGLTGAVSDAFDVYGRLYGLEILTRPRAAFSGDILPVQPVLRLRDSLGITVRDTTTVTATLVGPTSGALGGTRTVTAVNGQATFTNLTMAGIGGVRYQLAFDGAFDLSARDSVMLHRIDIVTQPQANVNGTVLPTVPVVRILDGDDNLVTNQSKVIVVAVDSGPAGTVSGNSVATTNGAATFSSLALTGILGNKYRLSFSAPGLSAVRANAVQIMEQTFRAVSTGPTTPVLTNWTVPSGVGALDIEVQGGSVDPNWAPTLGIVTGILSVSPGSSIVIAPGNPGRNADGGTNALGFGNGGSTSATSGTRTGGGAASILRVGTADIIAAGSGGACSAQPKPFDPLALSGGPNGDNGTCGTPGGGGGAFGGRVGSLSGYPGSNSNGGFADLTMSYLQGTGIGSMIRIRVR